MCSIQMCSLVRTVKSGRSDRERETWFQVLSLITNRGGQFHLWHRDKAVPFEEAWLELEED